MEIRDIREAGEDGCDLMGFYAKGHHEAHVFAQAVNAHTGALTDWDRRHVIPRHVRQTWWRNVPISGQPGFYAFNTAEPNSRGAYAVTVWDRLSEGDLDLSRRVIREHHRGKCNGIAEGVNWALRYVETIHGFEACEAMLTAFRAKRDQIEGDAL